MLLHIFIHHMTSAPLWHLVCKRAYFWPIKLIGIKKSKDCLIGWTSSSYIKCECVCVCLCVRVMFKHILQVFTWLCGVSVFIGGLFQPPLPLIHVADRLSASAKSFICPIVILLTPYINTEPFLSVRCLSCSPTVLIFLRLVCTDWL